MKKINLNSEILDHIPDAISLVQRGLYYHDSLFESIRVFSGQIPFIQQHWERLERGLKLMRYDIPAYWSSAFFEHEILKIASLNARIRLTVWRGQGGLYAPSDNTPLFLITVQTLNATVFDWLESGLKVCLSETVRLPLDAYSGLKTLNASRYVAAALEARERGFDDAIILNSRDSVCEAVGGNVCWIKSNQIYTTPLADGALTGIMRGLLLTLTFDIDKPIIEKSITFAQLIEADELFLTNAIRGIVPVSNLEGKDFETHQTKQLFEVLVGFISQKVK